MTEKDRDTIQEAADRFAEIVKGVVGENGRVAVFYNYLDDDEWVSGKAGNQNSMERVGSLHLLLNFETK